MAENAENVVPIVERYIDYTPPFPVVSHLMSALECVPVRFLHGLNAIVLTNAGVQSREDRRRRVKSHGMITSRTEATGAYFRAHAGQKARIEIYLDVLFSREPIRHDDMPELHLSRVVKVMFHEIGHHVHRTHLPRHRNPEREAERFVSSFAHEYLRRNPQINEMLKTRWGDRKGGHRAD